MEIIGLLLAILVGISLGLIGSGGSILTIPILVYIIGIEPVLATAYSLFIVGTTALTGGIINAYKKNVDFKTVVIFGIPSIISIYITRLWIVHLIPDILCTIGSFTITKPIGLMLLFALVMIFSAIRMIRPELQTEENSQLNLSKYNYPLIFVIGILVGLLTGLVGAGGGFLIIPSLVLLARMNIKNAIGTSLFIIAVNALIGFMGDLQSNININWFLLFKFTCSAIIGIFIGTILSKKITGEKLKSAFGWFVLVMAFYIILKETIIK